MPTGSDAANRPKEFDVGLCHEKQPAPLNSCCVVSADLARQWVGESMQIDPVEPAGEDVISNQ